MVYIKVFIRLLFFLPTVIYNRAVIFLAKYDTTHAYTFKLDGIEKHNGKDFVIYKSVFSGKLFSCALLELLDDRKDILSGFSVDDIVTLVAFAEKKYDTAILEKNNNSAQYLPLLSMLFAAAFILSNIAASKLGSINGWPVTGAFFKYRLVICIFPKCIS